jgi:hypothetical protein
MEVILESNGGYQFTGTFYDPDALDYSFSLVFVIVGDNGIAFTFAHTGSLHGWADRWIEGGSNEETWSDTGSNPVLEANWAALCGGWDWQGKAAINVALGPLLDATLGLFAGVVEVIGLVG